MATQFKEQGGAATMDPGPFRRWFTSTLMTRISSAQALERRRAKAERRRVKTGEPHRVEYFHQVDDGYSHLVAQVLQQFAARYDIELVCHLVSGPSGKNMPEPELLPTLAHRDAALIAPGYGLEFLSGYELPPAALAARANAILAAQDGTTFPEVVYAVSRALWRGDSEALEALAQTHGRLEDDGTAAAVSAGDERLRELGHYSGAMFYYAGEWYWGVDRLHYLEERLEALGADQSPGDATVVSRPSVETGPLTDNGSLTLEVFPSLRSPYTAISFDRAVALAAATGVTLSVRPVLPMVMRGVSATRQKGIYIFTDAAREARAAGVPYGNFYDPIGEPARRAYSLYPWACEQGRGGEFISAFLRCAFAEGVNTNSGKGLARVVESAGLNWQEAQAHLGDPAWEAMLEENRQAMYASGLWGVPSFRVLNAAGEECLAVWGQDRLWLVAREIQQQLAQSRPVA